MIELNLLPKELRRTKQMAMPDIPVVPIAIAMIVLVILTHAVVFLSIKSNQKSLEKFNKEWKELRPGRESAEKLNNQIASLERRLRVTKNIANPTLDWAELLSGLNQATISNVWLSEFRPIFSKPKGRNKDKKKNTLTGLQLSGYAVGRGEEASTVGKFIDSLKRNEEFSKYFREIELQGIHQQKFDTEEVMAFKLVCKFKKPEDISKQQETKTKKK